MKPFQPTTVNPSMMSKYATHILTAVTAIGFSAAISIQLMYETGRTADALHRMQSARIDSLEAEVARLNSKLIGGAIIVIDCKEQATGRMTR